MRAADTNVLARFILRDDESQFALAVSVLREPVWIASSVLLELGWLLGRRLAMNRGIVADALRTILMVETVSTFDTPGLLWAVERFRAGADWADMVHLVSVKDKARSFTTFDHGIARLVGSESPVPIVTLR